MISIMGKRKSNSVKQIIQSTSIKKLYEDCKVIINYGLAGEKLKNKIISFPFITSKHIINKFIGYSKYYVLQIAKKNNILIPKTFLELPLTEEPKKYLSKKHYSIGGKGIDIATSRDMLYERYYQEFIKDRIYEIRVHAFKWLSKSIWTVQRRIGDTNTIAWNFHNGGRFQNIPNQNIGIYNEAKNITDKLLTVLNMSFGASDFIISSDNQLYFLEINSAPGFTDFSKHIYIKAFTELTKLPITVLNKLN